MNFGSIVSALDALFPDKGAIFSTTDIKRNNQHARINRGPVLEAFYLICNDKHEREAEKGWRPAVK